MSGISYNLCFCPASFELRLNCHFLCVLWYSLESSIPAMKLLIPVLITLPAWTSALSTLQEIPKFVSYDLVRKYNVPRVPSDVVEAKITEFLVSFSF